MEDQKLVVSQVTEEYSEDLSVQLILGGVKLDCDSFFELRPGVELIFEVPATFEGTLTLEGRAWAKVSIKGVGAHLKLTILELIS